ncbi:MAG: hypothetical protein JRJ87_01010 [Deltaproteobacteria bacterium]|nr:hypothetical protein [Deltaproteobacteria bacterium]
MKVQCPACRDIIEMEKFSTSDAGLSFVCTNCSASNFIKNPQSQSQTAGSSPPATSHAGDQVQAELEDSGNIVCPKCGHSQADPHACHLCGLVFSKVDQASLPPDPAEAADLWQQITSNPDDEDLHESFMKTCIAANRLDYAARQYRIFSRQPGQQQISERMLSRLLAKGQAHMAPASLAPGAREDPKRKGRIIFWVLMLLSAALFAYFIIYAAEAMQNMNY